MANIERCPRYVGDRECDRRAAHHGHCATGGSYAEALDERDDARQQLREVVAKNNALQAALDLALDQFEFDAPVFAAEIRAMADPAVT